MSRIHEALRRAEKERKAGPAPENLHRAVEDLRPATPHREVYPAAAVSASVLAPPLEAPEAAPPPTIEELLSACRQQRWTPDPKKVVFSELQNHAHGYEQFRTLRSNLSHFRDNQALKTVLITSALPEEGKTFVAANLAHSMVRQKEKRALLIDADLRHPRLHLSLGAPATPGLSEYLRGSADESAILQRGPLENLYFIPGGATVANAAELLVNGRLKRLLDRLSPAFDWVILDSPPSIPVSDSGLLADHCDGVLIVVSAGMTPFDLAQKVTQRFRDKHLLGVVLNRADRGHSYGSYYYSGYSGKAANSADTKK